MEEMIIKLMTIVTILNILRPLIFKIFHIKLKINVLGCGLVGYCGNVPANPHLIKILMMYNMGRGEDSTGWVINNKITKETKKVAQFLAENELVFSQADENYTFIGHARNGSSGLKTNPELAHPFGVYKNSIEKERYDLVLAMNGTFTSGTMSDFAKEFQLTFTYNNSSDTQLMAKAMANLGEKDFKKVLQRYPGSATLLFFSPKYPNSLMIWKDPERPLFIWSKNKSQVYISSIEESLMAIGAPKDKVLTFSDSHLYTIQEGFISKKEEIKRNPIKFETSYGRDSYEDMYEGMSSYSGSPLVSKKTTPDRLTIAQICDRPPSNLHSNKGNKLYCVMDKYYRNGHPVHGRAFVDPTGKLVYDKSDKSYTEEYKEMFFIYGYKIKDESTYNELLNKCRREPDIPSQDPFDINKFKVLFVSNLCNDYCGYPLITNAKGIRMWVVPKDMNNIIKDKTSSYEYTPFLSDYKFTFGYSNRVSTRTGSKFFIDSKVEKVVSDSDVSDIVERFKDVDNINFICSYVRASKTVPSSLDIFSEITSKLWMKNKTHDINKYFHENVLLPFLVEDDHLPKNEADDIIRQAESKDTSWGDFNVKTDLTASIKSLKRKLKEQETHGDMQETIQESEKEAKLLGMETKDKIALLKIPESAYSNAEIIKSITEANPMMESASLRKDIYDGKEFDLIVTNHLNDEIAGGKDTLYFYEAMLLTLLHADQATEEEVLETLESDLRTIISKVKTCYGYWLSTINSEIKIVEDTKKTSKKETEEKKKEVSEEFNAYKEDMKTMLKEILEQADFLEEDEKPEDFEIEVISKVKKAVKALQ